MWFWYSWTVFWQVKFYIFLYIFLKMNFHKLISIFVFKNHVFLFMKEGSAGTPVKRQFERRHGPSCYHSFERPVFWNSYFWRKGRNFDVLKLIFGRSIFLVFYISFTKWIFITLFQFLFSKNMFFYFWKKEARAHQPRDGLRDAAALLAIIVLKYQYFEILILEERNLILTLQNWFLAGPLFLFSLWFLKSEFL